MNVFAIYFHYDQIEFYTLNILDIKSAKGKILLVL